MLNRHKDVLAKSEDPEAKKVMESFAAVLDTEPGKRVFAHLFFLAGYDKADHVLSPRDGEVVESATGFNTIRRSFYVDVRNRVPKSHRKTLLEVELLAEEGWGSGLPKPAAEKADSAK